MPRFFKVHFLSKSFFYYVNLIFMKFEITYKLANQHTENVMSLDSTDLPSKPPSIFSF